MDKITLNYYNTHAQDFVQGTVGVDFHITQDRFLAQLEKDASILDFGCGSGRDTKYFLEHGFAVEATAGASKEIERKKAAAHQREMERRAEAEKKAASLRGKVITVTAKCGAQGRLYGSITGQEIADALNAQHQVSVDKRKIDLAEPIRAVGETDVVVKLYPEISAKMTVRVVGGDK